MRHETKNGHAGLEWFPRAQAPKAACCPSGGGSVIRACLCLLGRRRIKFVVPGRALVLPLRAHPQLANQCLTTTSHSLGSRKLKTFPPTRPDCEKTVTHAGRVFLNIRGGQSSPRQLRPVAIRLSANECPAMRPAQQPTAWKTPPSRPGATVDMSQIHVETVEGHVA